MRFLHDPHPMLHTVFRRDFEISVRHRLGSSLRQSGRRRALDALAMVRRGALESAEQWSWVALKTGERFDGLRACVIQHEMDHLEGRLIA